MRIQEIIQSTIHKMEVGGGGRWLRVTALVLAVLVLAVAYNFRAYRNFSSPEAMDSAQLAHNIADGKGYTTLFIRPFSLYLIQTHNETKTTLTLTNASDDLAQIKTAHPDIANAPLYPVVLAGLMKLLPFHYDMELKKPFWSDGGIFSRYQPDFLIALFNEILLLAVVAMTFMLARKLFDAGAAWLSAGLIVGNEVLWRFSASGLSTMLLMVIIMGLAWCVLKTDEEARGTQPNARRLLFLALAAGALAGLGALTRYSFGWVIIPLGVFLMLFSGQRRAVHTFATVVMFALVLTPWIVRDYMVSGTPFGTAGFAIFEGSYVSQGFSLERSVHPDLAQICSLTPCLHKLLINCPNTIQTDLPRLGGSWVTMLFLTGLLLGFRNVAARRMRYFLLMCLGVFIVCEAMGQTQLSVESPDINSENLLVLFAPLVFMYGASLFMTFLDQMNLRMPPLRYLIIALFMAVSCLPMVSTLTLQKVQPVAYPPYYPPEIQQTSRWMNSDELMMSDVPWAVAWYGQRQCAWITLDAQDEFFAINDYLKPVQALYLTTETLDEKFLSQMARSNTNSWERLVLNVGMTSQFPKNFPLKTPKILTTGIFITDRERWKLQQ